MYRTESGEPFAVVPSEELVDVLVGIEPQELTDDLYGEDLSVGELGYESALTEPAPSFELIIHQTKDSDNEGEDPRERRPPFVLDGLEHHRE